MKTIASCFAELAGRNVSATVVAVTLTVVLAGCASTRMTSLRNPEVAGRSFTKVLVHGNFESLEQRRVAEEKLCSGLAGMGRVCLKSSEVFFPGQAYTAEQIASRLTELEIDAILTLQPLGSGTTKTYLPQTTHTTGTATIEGNTVKTSSTTHTSGGNAIEHPWANYEATLWSIADAKVAWYATAETAGSALARGDDLVSSASNETISKLEDDGVFR